MTQEKWRLHRFNGEALAQLIDMLEARHYDQAERLLRDLLNTNDQPDATSDRVMTTTLWQICRACSQCVAEQDWHQNVLAESLQREQLLLQQVKDLLGLLHVPAASEHTPPLAEPSTELYEQAHGDSTPHQRSATRPPPGALAQRQDASSLTVYCLGPFHAYLVDRPLNDWQSQKSRSIFKYLALHRRVPVTKDVLIDIFWPEADIQSARRNLHQAIYSLRQTLRHSGAEQQIVLLEHDHYMFNPAVEIWIDCEEFVRRIELGQQLERDGQIVRAMHEYGIAEEIYQGDLIEEDLYEEWIGWERERYRTLYLSTADRLSEYYVQQRQYLTAAALCRKIIERDSCHEDAHRRLMRCFIAQGQRHLAARQYQICARALNDELGLTPVEETQQLYERIWNSPNGSE